MSSSDFAFDIDSSLSRTEEIAFLIAESSATKPGTPLIAFKSISFSQAILLIAAARSLPLF